MRNIRGIAALILFSALISCETVWGPEGKEPTLQAIPPVLGQPYDMFIEGEPNLALVGVKGGYYIWKVGNSWHIRLTRTDIPHIGFQKDFFTGDIRVEGGFITNVNRQNAQPLDDVRSDLKSIFFRFETQRDVKGIDFRIQPADPEYCINIDLQVNGLTDPGLVHLGRTMFIPDTLPMRMCFRR